MTASWTAGRYLQARRAAAGRTLADVAAQLHTTPHRTSEADRIQYLAQVEADGGEVTGSIAAAYRAAQVRFDMDVLVALVPPLPARPPRLCRSCGCSEHDACNASPRSTSRAGLGCCWVELDLCSVCARTEPQAAAA